MLGIKKLHNAGIPGLFLQLAKCPKCQIPDLVTTTAQVGVGANPPEGADITRRNPPGGGAPPENGGPPNGVRPPGGEGAVGRRAAPPGFDEAAQKLGVSEEALTQAMQEAGEPQAELSEMAEKLGVSEADLREALPLKPN